MDGMNWRGKWKSTIAYAVGDVVYYENDGFTYVCIRENKPGFSPEYRQSGFELMAGFQVNIDPLDGGEF